jgi:putative transposase
MPWKTNTMKDVRREFALKALSPGANLSALCREYGVTRKTGRQWRERAKMDGISFVAEKSRRPAASPKQLTEGVVCHLIRHKLAHPSWGPRKIQEVYRREFGRSPSLSSCHRILVKAGLVERRRKRTKQPPRMVMGAVKANAPNEVWTVDFKGWWKLGNGERCEPLTVRDAFSRFILAIRLPANARTGALKDEFRRLFQLYGLPKVSKSDNGSPFASVRAPLGLSRLSAWWVGLGIELERSRPGSPQDNGAHERMHKDVAHEIAATTQPDGRAQQAALDVWREEFNVERPHEALQGRSPIGLYRKSPRPFPAEPLRLDYGVGYYPRKVIANGSIKWNGQTIFISNALAGWEVGLRVVAQEQLEVWLNYLQIGTIDLQTNRFGGAPSRSAKAVSLAA